MAEITDDVILSSFPRPIAWAFSEYARASGRVAQFHHLLELAEETIRYLTDLDTLRAMLDRKPEETAKN
jgi:hypothetical protein